MLPDVILSADSTIAFTTSGGYSATVTMKAGSWFASPANLIEYAVNLFNTTGSSGSAVPASVAVNCLLVHNGAKHADNGKIRLSWTGGGSFGMEYTANATELQAILGQATFALTTSTPYTFSSAVSGFFEPTFPLADYSIGSIAREGYSSVATDSTLYSLQGYAQKSVTISFNVLMSAGYSERDSVKSLFSDRWLVGRSVLAVLDPVSWYGATDLGGADKSKAHSLVALSATDVSFTRLVREKETVSVCGPLSLALRVPVPMTAGDTQTEVVVT